MKKYLACLAIMCCLGCGGKVKEEAPQFSFAVSEYPSWSTFLVADNLGLIKGRAGEQGELEKKYNVDVVLKEVDYDTCITLFSNGKVDASCQTNMDSLSPSIGRRTVAICPTSTSVGGDACVVVGINNIEDLKGVTTYGLEKSVSQYAFERVLTKHGFNPKDFTYKNMDPAAASQAVQTGQKNITSIQVWNPFVLQTLRTRQESKVLFDSSSIPEEIIDMIIVGEDTLQKKGGEDFACCIVETFYQVSKRLGPAVEVKAAVPEQKFNAAELVSTLTEDQKKALVALGAKFSNLPAEDMALCTHQTRFYKDADQGIELFKSDRFQNETIPTVVKFCVDHQIVDESPRISFGDAAVLPDAQLRFTTKYMEKVR